MEKPEEKVPVAESLKSSSEILTELFSTFDAEPPLIIKKEEYTKKTKKSKKKHKHKDKKHKRKSKKRKRSHSNSSNTSDEELKLDLAKVLLKQERETPEKKIKLESNKDEDSNDFNVVKQKNNESANVNFVTDNKDLIKIIKAENKDKDEESKTENSVSKDEPECSQSESKIKIQNLKFSSIFKQTILEIQEKQKTDSLNSNVNLELTDISGLSEEEIRKFKKHKHKHSHKSSSEHKKDKHKTENKEKHRHRSDSDSRNCHHSQERSYDKEEEKDRTEKDRKHSEKDVFYGKHDRKIYKDKYREDYKDKYNEKDSGRGRYSSSDLKHKKDDRRSYKEDDSWGRSYREDYSRKEDKKDDKRNSKDRYREHNEIDKGRDYKQKIRSKSQERDYIDKKKLLEIARKNAIQMMRSGSLPAALTLGPQAQEKVLAAIRAGGKTIEELTEFCKTLSKKEELGELSSVSEDDNESDTDRPFHHPFQIKDRPTSIIMNIKNSVPLPTKTSQERSTELRMQFPVSSGQQHRKTENEWVPVSPKKTEAPVPPVAHKVITPAPPPVIEEAPKAPIVQQLPITVPGPQVFPLPAEPPVDIGMIVSQRLSAMRKLQENPNDVQAISEMYRAQKEMQSWAQSKQQPGQFTGSTGAQILSQAELCSGYQAWAKKDQLQNAAPVSGGMGMHLLQKMGWRPGEGLGKEKTGTLEPLLLEVKLNKKGLVANEEQRRKPPVKGNPGPKISVKSLEGKHPVSLLGEYAAKKKLGPPIYELCDENGPDHKKTFLFKVILNGTEYKPSAPNFNKKHAKRDAAQTCLQILGLLPPS